MIKSSGMNVYPAQVEDVLYQHPDVRDACVVGIPDPNQIERVKAFVVLKDPGKAGPEMEKALIEHCREHLIKWSCPREVEFQRQPALDSSGKDRLYGIAEAGNRKTPGRRQIYGWKIAGDLNMEKTIMTAFDELESIYADRGKCARALHDKGEKVIGYFCCYVPEEIITAMGMVPFRIQGSQSIPIDEADAYIEPTACPFARSCFQPGAERGVRFSRRLCRTAQLRHSRAPLPYLAPQ